MASAPPFFFTKDDAGNVQGFANAAGKFITPRVGSHTAFRVFDGRMEATSAVNAGSGTTYQTTLTLADVPDVIWPIFSNGGATTYEIAAMSCAASSDSDINGASSTWTVGSVAGATTVPARSATKVAGWLLGNQMLIDNPTGSKVVTIRAFVAAGIGTITIMGNGANGVSTNLQNWATRTGQVHAFRSQTGDQTATAGAFTSTTNTSCAVIVGCMYISRGRVITIMISGDSISSGQGTYKNDSPFREALAIQARTGYSVEVCQISWAGTSTTSIKAAPAQVFAAGIIPTMFFAQIGSPNDVSSAISDATVTVWRQSVVDIKKLCGTYGIEFGIRTMCPANSSIDAPAGSENYGADDAKRVTLNTEILTWKSRGVRVFDWSTCVSGTVNVNGQIPFADGDTTDAIHPNDTGNTKIAVSMAATNQLP